MWRKVEPVERKDGGRMEGWLPADVDGVGGGDAPSNPSTAFDFPLVCNLGPASSALPVPSSAELGRISLIRGVPGAGGGEVEDGTGGSVLLRRFGDGIGGRGDTLLARGTSTVGEVARVDGDGDEGPEKKPWGDGLPRLTGGVAAVWFEDGLPAPNTGVEDALADWAFLPFARAWARVDSLRSDAWVLCSVGTTEADDVREWRFD